jgi:hypothetical protein
MTARGRDRKSGRALAVGKAGPRDEMPALPLIPKFGASRLEVAHAHAGDASKRNSGQVAVVLSGAVTEVSP